jgi:hypothetical protein
MHAETIVKRMPGGCLSSLHEKQAEALCAGVVGAVEGGLSWLEPVGATDPRRSRLEASGQAHGSLAGKSDIWRSRSFNLNLLYFKVETAGI